MLHTVTWLSYLNGPSQQAYKVADKADIIPFTSTNWRLPEMKRLSMVTRCLVAERGLQQGLPRMWCCPLSSTHHALCGPFPTGSRPRPPRTWRTRGPLLTPFWPWCLHLHKCCSGNHIGGGIPIPCCISPPRGEGIQGCEILLTSQACQASQASDSSVVP